MRISQLFKGIKSDFLDFNQDYQLVKKNLWWEYSCSVYVNGIIAVGWFKNNDILIIGADGIFIYDIKIGQIINEDYETNFAKHISDNNIFYFFEERNETLNIFGLRGGGGNCFSSDNKWHIEIVCLSWRSQIPKLINLRDNSFDYLELSKDNYEDKLFCGFSEEQNHFLIRGNNSIDVFSKSSC